MRLLERRELDDWPPIRSPFRERHLRLIVRAERCACGDVVHQLAGDTVAQTIVDHNAGAAHRAWRAAGGPTAVDVSGASGRPLPRGAYSGARLRAPFASTERGRAPLKPVEEAP